MPVEAVIFDIGGVLEITPPTGWQQRWSTELGIALVDFEARLEPIFYGGATGAMTLRGVEEGIATALGLDEERLAAFMDDLWAEYLGTLNEGLAAYFAGLRPRHRTGILSNSFVGAREREQELYGFADICDVVVYSHEEGIMKPDPRFYRVVSDRLGVSPDRCVLLDDAQVCVDGARAIGMHAIRFIDNDQAIRDLEQLLGDPAASNLGQS